MPALICNDDIELRRIESSIAAIEAGSPGDMLRRRCLLAALYAERKELLRYARRAARSRQPSSAAARLYA